MSLPFFQLVTCHEAGPRHIPSSHCALSCAVSRPSPIPAPYGFEGLQLLRRLIQQPDWQPAYRFLKSDGRT
jgi:hypothetical protein